MLQKHLKDDQRKQEAPEHHCELISKGWKHSCTCDFSVYYFKYICKNLKKNLFYVVIMGCCVQNFKEKKYQCNPLWNKAVTQQSVEKVKRCEYSISVNT